MAHRRSSTDAENPYSAAKRLQKLGCRRRLCDVWRIRRSAAFTSSGRFSFYKNLGNDFRGEFGFDGSICGKFHVWVFARFWTWEIVLTILQHQIESNSVSKMEQAEGQRYRIYATGTVWLRYGGDAVLHPAEYTTVTLYSSFFLFCFFTG